MSATAQTLRPPSKLLMLLEGRALNEFGAFLGTLPLLSFAPRGDGHPVLVLPGLVASDLSTRPLRSFLKGRGYVTSGWRLGRNYGLRDGVQRAMVDLVHELSDEHGRKISLVGWSLGGLYARQLAKIMPGASMSSPAAAAPMKRTCASAERLPSRRRCRPPRSSAAQTVSAPGRAAWREPPLNAKASRSKAAIAAWAIIPPWSMPWRNAWRSPKGRGGRSTAAAGAASSSPIRTGRTDTALLNLAPLAGRGRILRAA
jgi:pimeloyl-ACP methyl ester carboxylesterase